MFYMCAQLLKEFSRIKGKDVIKNSGSRWNKMKGALSSALKQNFSNSLNKALEPLGQLEELDGCSGMYNNICWI